MQWDVDVDNGDRGFLFDANGVQIKHPLRANLKTGEYEGFSADENGRKYPAKDGSGGAERIRAIRPAPLRFEAKQ